MLGFELTKVKKLFETLPGRKPVPGRVGLWFVCVSYDGSTRRLNQKCSDLSIG